jgi:hypothetical protein
MISRARACARLCQERSRAALMSHCAKRARRFRAALDRAGQESACCKHLFGPILAAIFEQRFRRPDASFTSRIQKRIRVIHVIPARPLRPKSRHRDPGQSRLGRGGSSWVGAATRMVEAGVVYPADAGRCERHITQRGRRVIYCLRRLSARFVSQ